MTIHHHASGIEQGHVHRGRYRDHETDGRRVEPDPGEDLIGVALANIRVREAGGIGEGTAGIESPYLCRRSYQACKQVSQQPEPQES